MLLKLEVLEQVGDERASDIAGESVERGLVLLEKSGSGLAHLVLFPEDEIGIGQRHRQTITKRLWFVKSEQNIFFDCGLSGELAEGNRWLCCRRRR